MTPDPPIGIWGRARTVGSFPRGSPSPRIHSVLRRWSGIRRLATVLTDVAHHGRANSPSCRRDRSVVPPRSTHCRRQRHAPPRVPPWGNNAVEPRNHSSPRSSNDMQSPAARCLADRSGAGGRIRLFSQLGGLCAWEMCTKYGDRWNGEENDAIFSGRYLMLSLSQYACS